MRIKYDYERLIFTEHLDKEFHYYCRGHKKIKSKRRLARNFLLSRGFKVDDFKKVTNESLALDEMIRIAKVNWL